MAKELIRTENIKVQFDDRTVLYDVNMHVSQGEIVTIIGPNGGGKSTLAKLLIGAVKPTSGTIIRNPKLQIGYVPQRLDLPSSLPLTTRRFLGLQQQDKGAQDECLAKVGALDLVDKQLIDLSGGQFQRILLAAALMNQPNLLVLDEPTRGLDQHGTALFYRLIDDIRTQSQCGIVLVSHDLHVVMRNSDQVLCVNGHVCCQGAPSAISNSPEYHALFDEQDDETLALYHHQHDDHAH